MAEGPRSWFDWVHSERLALAFQPIAQRETTYRIENQERILKILVARNLGRVLYVSTFDENLLKHISHELADDARREGDTS
jgi:hypothetical protein